MFDYITRKFTSLKTNLSTWYKSMWTSKPIVKPSVANEPTIDDVTANYKQLEKEINKLVANTEITEAKQMLASLQEENARLKALVEKSNVMQTTVGAESSKVNQDSKALDEANRRITNMQKVIEEKDELIVSFNTNREHLNTKLATQDKTIKQLEQELRSKEASTAAKLVVQINERDRVITQLNAVKDELANKDKAIDQLNLTIQKQKQELYGYTENSNKNLKRTANAKNNTIKEAEVIRENLTLEVETQQNTVKDLRDTIEEKDIAIKELQEKLTLATNAIEGLNKEKENLHVQLQAQNTQVNPLAVRVKELEILLAKQKETLAQTQNEYTSEHRKVIKSNEDVYRLKLRIQELEQKLTTAEMTTEMRTTTNNKLQGKIKDLKMQLENKDRSLAEMQAELDNNDAHVTATLDEQNNYIAELEAHITTLQQKDSNGLAEMGNQLSAQIQEIHISKDFIEKNYQAVKEMFAATATYRECINQTVELKQKIFVMEAQALDHEIGYKLSKNQEELRLQKMCESYVTEYTTELRKIEQQLQTAIENTENCYKQVNNNIQQFYEDHQELDKQINDATEILTTPTKPLSPLEKIHFDFPVRDIAETKKTLLALINNSSRIPDTQSNVTSASNQAKTININTTTSIEAKDLEISKFKLEKEAVQVPVEVVNQRHLDITESHLKKEREYILQLQQEKLLQERKVAELTVVRRQEQENYTTQMSALIDKQAEVVANLNDKIKEVENIKNTLFNMAEKVVPITEKRIQYIQGVLNAQEASLEKAYEEVYIAKCNVYEKLGMPFTRDTVAIINKPFKDAKDALKVAEDNLNTVIKARNKAIQEFNQSTSIYIQEFNQSTSIYIEETRQTLRAMAINTNTTSSPSLSDQAMAINRNTTSSPSLSNQAMVTGNVSNNNNTTSRSSTPMLKSMASNTMPSGLVTGITRSISTANRPRVAQPERVVVNNISERVSNSLELPNVPPMGKLELPSTVNTDTV